MLTVEDCDSANKQMGGNFADRFLWHCLVPDDVTSLRWKPQTSEESFCSAGGSGGVSSF